MILLHKNIISRIWKKSVLFSHGEFLETTPLGGGIYPTIANVNHSCDPNFTIIYFGKKAVAISDRKIKAGEELHDSYGAVYYNMEKIERQKYLKVQLAIIFWNIQTHNNIIP